MRRWVPVLVLVLAGAGGVAAYLSLRTSEAPPLPPRESPRLALTTFRLPSGLSGDVLAGPCGGRGALVVTYGVGFEHDAPGKSGLAFVIGELSKNDWPDGQAPSVEVGRLTTTLAFRLGADRQAAVRSIFERVAVLTAPTEEALGAAKDVVLERRRAQRGGDAEATAVAYAIESLQSSRAEGNLGGVDSEIGSITVQDIATSFAERYARASARLVVVGEVEPSAIEAAAQSVFPATPERTELTLAPHAPSSVTGTLTMGDRPRFVAWAVRAPLPNEATYPAFLVLAARLAAAPELGSLRFEPADDARVLLLGRSVPDGLLPDPVAEELRAAVASRLAPPLALADVENTRSRFADLLALDELAPERCQRDALGLALARSRRSTVGVDPVALARRIGAVTDADLDSAREAFAPKSSSAVAAGGDGVRGGWWGRFDGLWGGLCG